jgi:hypothetical protein
MADLFTAHSRSRVKGGVDKEEGEWKELHNSFLRHPTQGDGIAVKVMLKQNGDYND